MKKNSHQDPNENQDEVVDINDEIGIRIRAELEVLFSLYYFKGKEDNSPGWVCRNMDSKNQEWQKRNTNS